MGHKKRGYTKDIPDRKRDYKLFAISCEGEREHDYFRVFERMSTRIKVDIVEELISDAEVENKKKSSQKSAPNWVLDRAMLYIEKEGLIDEDDLWLVMDRDKWEEDAMRMIASFCDEHPNWHIVISNPCFEVWLYFHKRAEIEKSESASSQDFKHEISTLEKGGYHPYKFIPDVNTAIKNAKAKDSDPNHFMPKHKETKVYQLAEALLTKIGKNGFNDFIKNELPKLRIMGNL